MSTTRPRCSVYIAVSLDGYIAGPGGELDWLSTVQVEGEDYGYAAFFASVDALVIGRRTYETALEFAGWPYAGKTCVVLTHAELTSRHGERFVAAAPETVLAQLHAEGIRHVYVDGGAVIRSFLAAGVVDDLTLSIVPILLGDGVRLFGDDPSRHALRLVTATPYQTGLVQLHYVENRGTAPT